MARQVYFDPFGMRLEGYRAGIQDETAMQRSARQFRDSDWEYQYMNPLRHRAAVREDVVGEAGVPYRQRAFGLNERAQLGNLYDAENSRWRSYGIESGDYSPQIANQGAYMSGQYNDYLRYMNPYIRMTRNSLDGGSANPRAEAMNAGVDPYMFEQFVGRIPMRVTPGQERGYDQFNLYERTRQRAMDDWLLERQRREFELQQEQARINAMNAESLRYDRMYNNPQTQYAPMQDAFLAE